MTYSLDEANIRQSLLKLGAREVDVVVNLAEDRQYGKSDEMLTIFRIPSDKMGPISNPYFICRIQYSTNPQDVIIAISDKVPTGEAYYHAFMELAQHLKKDGSFEERVRKLEKALEKEKKIVTLERHECPLISCLTRLYPIEK